MTTTLVGYFDDYAEARDTEQDLINAGFRGEDVSIVFQAQEPITETTAPEPHGFWERLKAKLGFANDEERHTYEEAARHGGALLTICVMDRELDDAATIIERHHPVDLDERMEQWRGASTTEMATPTPEIVATNMTTGTPSPETASAQAEQTTLPIAQEELQVGKRMVQRGGVRIHTYVTEQPVEEQVMLREEQAMVERTPVQRAAQPGEDLFQERTIEVKEMGEEAMVSKQARVVEEIAVSKQETERPETVRESVKKTEVDVKKDPQEKKT